MYFKKTGEVSNDGIPLMRKLERQLQTFGSHLQPYTKERAIVTRPGAVVCLRIKKRAEILRPFFSRWKPPFS